jgi:hypothetical protein
MSVIKILVAHHKKGFIHEDEIITPIHVGAANSKFNLGILRDDKGENISELNPIFCELTAIYTAWKNFKHVENVGLFHYRRYLFVARKKINFFLISKFLLSRICGKLNKKFDKGVLDNLNYINETSDLGVILKRNSEKIKQLIENENIDLMMSKKYMFANTTVKKYFRKHFVKSDLYINEIEEIIRVEFSEFYEFYISACDNNFMYPANIFVMNWKYFDDYCNIIFTVLQKHYQKFCSKGVPVDYHRTCGYLAELITNAFIFKLKSERVKYKELPITFFRLNS